MNIHSFLFHSWSLLHLDIYWDKRLKQLNRRIHTIDRNGQFMTFLLDKLKGSA